MRTHTVDRNSSVNHGILTGRDSGSLIPSVNEIWDAQNAKSRAVCHGFLRSCDSYQCS